MSNNEKPINRNTGSIIAKCAIVLVVLGIVCSLSIWAWFTKSTKADATGINVIAKAEGVEVSWNGTDYFYDLTAKSEGDYKEGVTGYAKNLCDSEGNPLALKLITGDGLNFFEPYVNRRTGTPLVKNGLWQGVDIIPDVNSEGKFVDLDLYFRGTNASNIYLSGDSRVTPVDPAKDGVHKSSFGNFSKDNIASAARVAFLSTKTETDAEGNDVDVVDDCKFIWAPNANLRLKGNSDGYDRYVNVDHTPDTVAGDLGDFIAFTTKQDDYYLWLPTSYNSDDETQESSLTSNKMNFTIYDKVNQKGLYTFDFTIHPTQNKDVSLLYFINQNADDGITSNGVEWDHTDLSTYINTNASQANNVEGEAVPRIALGDTFTLKNGYVTNYKNPTSTWQQDRKGAAFYIAGTSFRNVDITVKLGYNPDTKEVIIVGYHCEGVKTYNRADKAVESYPYYELPNTNTNVALVNPKTSIAISAEQGNSNKKVVTFSDSPQNNNVTSLSVTLLEQFTATKIGEGIDAKYTFRNKSTGTFLAVKSDGTFSWETIGSEFSLYVHKDFTGPLLKCGDYFLVINNNQIGAVTLGNLDVKYAITVYVGTEYIFTYGSIETHEYYSNTEGNKGLHVLNTVTTPPLYTTESIIPDNPIDIENPLEVGPCIATLTAENNYTAHIKVRIWVEGTDDDAQTPLADGIFNVALHFTTKFTNTQ